MNVVITQNTTIATISPTLTNMKISWLPNGPLPGCIGIHGSSGGGTPWPVGAQPDTEFLFYFIFYSCKYILGRKFINGK